MKNLPETNCPECDSVLSGADINNGKCHDCRSPLPPGYGRPPEAKDDELAEFYTEQQDSCPRCKMGVPKINDDAQEDIMGMKCGVCGYLWCEPR